MVQSPIQLKKRGNKNASGGEGWGGVVRQNLKKGEEGAGNIEGVSIK